MSSQSDRNPYADHLVEVNRYNPVITTTDITNNLGATIIPKGTYLTEEVANKIARFSLKKPLELQVSLASTLSPSQMYSEMRAAKASERLLSENPKLVKEIVKQCGLINSFPLVSQKLTVFAERIPQAFKETQSACVYALLLSIELGLDDESLEIVFLATQMHEAGLLNMPPDLCEQRMVLGADQQREFDAEQLAHGKAFLDEVPKLSARIGRAVLEHKERLDGSGWPNGIIGDTYSIESQVVGMAVMLNETLDLKLKERGFGFNHLLPLTQIQGNAVAPDVFRGLVEMLRKNAQASARVLPDEFIPSLADYLVVLQRFLVHWFSLVKQEASEMDSMKSVSETHRALKIIEHLEDLFRNSGLWDQEIRTWLNSVRYFKTEEDYSEVEVVSLMFEGVIEKLKKLHWSINQAAQAVDPSRIIRCQELGVLLYGLPVDQFEALERYDCLLEG